MADRNPDRKSAGPKNPFLRTIEDLSLDIQHCDSRARWELGFRGREGSMKRKFHRWENENDSGPFWDNGKKAMQSDANLKVRTRGCSNPSNNQKLYGLPLLQYLFNQV